MYNAKRILSVFLAMLLVLGTFAVGGAGLALTASADASLPLSGSGARDDPYYIQRSTDWQALAQYVANGGDTEGKYFSQISDINAAVPVGTSEHPFRGTYNGHGMTLNVSLTSSDPCCAPFAYISSAMIRYVHVTGTVNGGIHCSGMIGSISGTGNRIYDCIVETSITTSGTHCGGMIGHGGTSETSIEGCVFSGSISGGIHVGVFWGWSNTGASFSIDNCLENGKAYAVQNLNPVALGNASSVTFGLIECVTPQIGTPDRNWTGAGVRTYSIRAGKHVSLDFGSPRYMFFSSGLSVYDSALMVCGDDAFAPAGKNIAMTMTCTSQNPGSGTAVFSASAGTLADGVLTMPGQDVTINVAFSYQGKAIEFGTEAFEVGCNSTYAATVYYGGSPWHVIGFDGQGVASESGAMTLLSAGSMGQTMFDQDGRTRKQYSGSDLEKQTNQIYNTAFSDPEQFAVKDTTLRSGTYDGANTDGVEGSSVGYARLWPLSTKEANAVNADLRKDSGEWWLRSPGDGDNNVAFVKKEGDVDHIGRSFRSELGVRPAFYFNLNKIAFLSAAADGKQGDGVLKPVGDNSSGEWKLTLSDNNRWFAVNETAVTASAGETANLTYTDAQTGENEYISVFLMGSDGAVRYYGRVAQPAAESGTVEIPIPAYFAEGTYTLKVFNEQYNGDCQTDVASAFSDVTLTVTHGNGKALQLTKNGVAANIVGAQNSAVWFGSYKQSRPGDDYNVDPIRWRVLSAADGKLFLLSDNSLDVFPFHIFPDTGYMSYNRSATWDISEMRKWLNGLDDYSADSFIGSAFTGEESPVIADSELVNADNTEYDVSGGSDTTDKVFLLTRDDVTNASYGFTDDYSRTAPSTDYVRDGGRIHSRVTSLGESNEWWLRSPGRAKGMVASVERYGELFRYSYFSDSQADSDGDAVRPALNVDLGKVLFTSPAVGGKQGEGLTAVGDYDGADWKLTLLDGSRAGFTVFCVGVDNNVYTVRYRGAKSGENEKISAMIVDEDGSVTYYGALCYAAPGENTITVDVSGKLGGGDKLYIFNEQTNGDKKSDYASALVFVDAAFASHDHEMGEWLPVDGDKMFHHRFCTCGAEEKEAHTFDTVTQATCTESGIVTYTCSVCGYSYSEEDPPLGHDYSTFTDEPTCTENGLLTYTCCVCGYSYSEVIPALGHDLQTTTVEATHFEEGSETAWCSRCSYSVVTPIPKLHDGSLSKIAIFEERNCTDTTYDTYYCSICDRNYHVMIPPLGHDLRTVIVEPTCTTDGYRRATCARSGCEYEEYEVYPSFGGHVRDEETGLCTRCGIPIFVVTFDANGGSAVETQMIVKDSSASFAETDRSGFIFAGWTLNGRLYDFSAPVTEDVTLTAAWIECTAGATESFETGSVPDGWTAGKAWLFKNYEPHTGDYHAYHSSSNATYLIMPAADLSAYAGAKLTFWYENRVDYLNGEVHVDHLRVCYRVNGGEWHELFRTQRDHDQWTQATVVLPPEAMQENVEIAFYADMHNGGGINLDDVTLFTSGHDLRVDVSGNVLTATCGNDSCALGSEKTLTLTLAAPEKTSQTDSLSAEATVIGADAMQLFYGAAVGDVEYYDGGTKLDAAPTEAGAFTAKVTVTIGGTQYVLAKDYRIADHVAGDADGNGGVNLKDVVLIRRYLAEGWDVTIDTSAVDVDGDKKVTLQDVVLLTRYLAGGWNVTLV